MIKKLLRIAKVSLWLGLAFILVSFLLVLSLRWINPPSSAFIFAYNFQHENKVKPSWRKLDKISPWLQMSVIAAEDQKFPQHWGFDFDSLQKAINEKRKRKRGASTISQQVAKNLFLWKGRSYVRKLIEAWFTVLMETLWPKERILEVYLNIVEFGPGIYGAENAARRYFNISAYELNSWQAGIMAAVLPNPLRMHIDKPSAYLESRVWDIYRQVQSLGGTSFLKNLN